MCCEIVAAGEYTMSAFDSENGAEEELLRWRQTYLSTAQENQSR